VNSSCPKSFIILDISSVFWTNIFTLRSLLPTLFTSFLFCALIYSSTKTNKKEVSVTYYQIKKERQRLNKQISALRARLQSLPEGKLLCTHNGNYSKWYLSNGASPIYIPKKERQFAAKLAERNYLSLLLEDLQQECRALDAYLQHHRTTKSAEHFLSHSPEHRNLIFSAALPLSAELSDWINTPYKQNPKHPEQLVHRSVSGHMLRSKSEVFIDMALFNNKLPFRYECALILGDVVLYPDFTIRHPKTGKTYYWEHFGRMDDPSYIKNACSKLEIYTSHGIVPSIHLITTYETRNHPLNPSVIEQIIEEYFL